VVAVCFFAATGIPVPARAQSSFGGEVAVGSQLVDRGLAVTPARPVVQGAVSWTTPGGWALGVSAGALMRSPGNIAESLVQGSRAWVVSTDWQVQAGLMYYRYTRIGNTREYKRAEAAMGWVYRDTLTLSLSAVRGISALDEKVRPGADIDFRWPLPLHLGVSAGAGFSQTLVVAERYGANGARTFYPRMAAYRYGHLGLSWERGPWRMELERVGTDLSRRNRRDNPGAAPWIGTVSFAF
jgi:hypothetical protein